MEFTKCQTYHVVSVLAISTFQVGDMEALEVKVTAGMWQS